MKKKLLFLCFAFVFALTTFAVPPKNKKVFKTCVEQGWPNCAVTYLECEYGRGDCFFVVDPEEFCQAQCDDI